jgi:hypothetical protein
MDTHFNRSFAIGVSIVFGSILVAGLAVYYISGVINTNLKSIVSDKLQISQQSNSIAIIAGLKHQAAQAAPYQAAMDQLLPTQDQLINFSQWVTNIAASHQVNTTVSFQGNPSNSSGSAGQTQFSFTGTGSMSALASLLDDLQSRSAGFLLKLTSVDLVDQGTLYQLNGQGTVFFR